MVTAEPSTARGAVTGVPAVSGWGGIYLTSITIQMRSPLTSQNYYSPIQITFNNLTNVHDLQTVILIFFDRNLVNLTNLNYFGEGYETSYYLD